MRLGGQTITYISIAQDTSNLDRYGKPALVKTETVIPGCLFRSVIPTYKDEKIDTLGDLTIDVWRLTAPPHPALMAAKDNDQVMVNGTTYEIQVGPRVFFDRGGRPVKITIICQSREG